jgi:hypothetical protein
VNYAFEHPWHGSGLHPWDDPYAPQDPFNPCPAAEIAALAGSGPQPVEFPFNSEGRRQYYEAVRSEFQMRQHLHRMRLLEQQQEEEAARRASFLLLG